MAETLEDLLLDRERQSELDDLDNNSEDESLYSGLYGGFTSRPRLSGSELNKRLFAYRDERIAGTMEQIPQVAETLETEIRTPEQLTPEMGLPSDYLTAPSSVEEMSTTQKLGEAVRRTPQFQTAEAVTSLATGAASGLLSIGTGVADAIATGILNEYYKQPQSPTHWRDIIGRMDALREQLTYVPRTTGGQNIVNVATLPIYGVHKLAQFVGDTAQKYGISEDKSALVEEATEIAGLLALGKTAGIVHRGMKSRAANFRAEVKQKLPKMLTGNQDFIDAEFTDISPGGPPSGRRLLTEARNIVEEVRNNPELRAELISARQRLVATLNQIGEEIPARLTGTLRAAGDPTRLTRTLRAVETELPARLESIPTEIPPARRPPIPMTGAIVFDPTQYSTEQLGVSPNQLVERVGQIAPSGSIIGIQPGATVTLLDNSTDTINPMGTGFSRELPEYMTASGNFISPNLIRSFKNRSGTVDIPVRREGAVSTPVETPTETPAALIRTEQEQLVPSNDEMYRRYQAGEIGNEELSPLNIAQGMRDAGVTLTPEQFTELSNDVRVLRTFPDAQEMVTEYVADMLASFHSSGEISTSPVRTPVAPVIEESGIRTPLQTAIDTVRNPEITGVQRTEALRELKRAAREGLRPNEKIEIGLTRLGFASDEITTLAPELRKIRAGRVRAEIVPRETVPSTPVETTPETLPSPVTIPAHTPVYDLTIAQPREGRQFTPVSSLNEIRALDFPITGQATLPERSIITAVSQNGKPEAIIIDERGFRNITPVSTIEQQVSSGTLSKEMGEALIGAARRQANLISAPVEEAHLITTERIQREALRLASDRNLSVYKRKYVEGNWTFEKIPQDVVDTSAQLNAGTALEPTTRSGPQREAYIAEGTSPVGPTLIDEIQASLETGVDITGQLPAQLVPHYKALIDTGRKGLHTNERRRLQAIISDINTLLGERGAIGRYGLSPTQRLAAQRLQSDALKAGTTFRNIARQLGIPRITRVLYERYLRAMKNTPPPQGINPNDMRFMRSPIPGDRIVKQRVVGTDPYTARNFPALWNSEVKTLQSSASKPFSGRILEMPHYALRRMGLSELFDIPYREVERSFLAARQEFRKDIAKIRRVISKDDERTITAYAYSLNPDGRRINAYNKVTPPTALTPTQQVGYDMMRQLYDRFYTEINRVRKATGREPLFPVQDYFTLSRAFTVMEELGLHTSLLSESAEAIYFRYVAHASQPFPYAKRRTHAQYTANYDGLNILQRYSETALRDIHTSPYTAKVSELIEHTLPDPSTGEMTWRLQNENPALYRFLHNRNSDILGIPRESTLNNITSEGNARAIERGLEILARNISGATLAAKTSTWYKQFGSLRNTVHEIGPVHTAKGIGTFLSDIFSGFRKSQQAMHESKVLRNSYIAGIENDLYTQFRNLDIRHPLRSVRGTLQSATSAAFIPMRYFDMMARLMTYHGAQSFGKKLGYTGEKLINYSDDIVTRTNGSALPGDLAGFQHDPLGRVITSMQTYSISDWNFLRNNTLFEGTPKERFLNTLRFIVATAAFTTVYEDIFGADSPFPSPIRDVAKSIENEDNPILTVGKGLVGMSEFIPIVGSGRYGSIGGPIASTAKEIFDIGTGRIDIESESGQRRAITTGAKILGIPLVAPYLDYVRKRDDVEYDPFWKRIDIR